MTTEPFAWKDRPSLIESVLPAQKISAEAQKERKAGAGQTLTALGSYWKGRKPLVLVKACVLGALLPVTDDPAGDLAIFEKLMAIDDEAFLRRGMIPSCLVLFKRLYSMGWMKEEEAKRLFIIHRRNLAGGKGVWERNPFEITEIDSIVKIRVWSGVCAGSIFAADPIFTPSMEFNEVDCCFLKIERILLAFGNQDHIRPHHCWKIEGDASNTPHIPYPTTPAVGTALCETLRLIAHPLIR